MVVPAALRWGRLLFLFRCLWSRPCSWDCNSPLWLVTMRACFGLQCGCIPVLKMEILDKIDVAAPKHGGFLFETTKVEMDAAVFRGSRCRDVRNPARPGGAARENQEGGWYHSPI